MRFTTNVVFCIKCETRASEDTIHRYLKFCIVVIYALVLSMALKPFCVACVCLIGVAVTAQLDELSRMPPLDCADVSCLLPKCLDGQELYTPPGSCCPRCRSIVRPPIDCALVRCAWPDCPPGEEAVKTSSDCCHVC